MVATNATTTGEATALYIADMLRERAPDVAVTRLASGLPVGADLEYADEITLGQGAPRPPRALSGARAQSEQAVLALRRQDPHHAPGRAALAADLPLRTALQHRDVGGLLVARADRDVDHVGAGLERLHGGVRDASGG